MQQVYYTQFPKNFPAIIATDAPEHKKKIRSTGPDRGVKGEVPGPGGHRRAAAGRCGDGVRLRVTGGSGQAK